VNATWVRIRSWHAVRSTRSIVDITWTLCGRQIGGATVVDDLPMDAKSCESCLRILARNAEAGP
jgi:hypothetical protein